MIAFPRVSLLSCACFFIFYICFFIFYPLLLTCEALCFILSFFSLSFNQASYCLFIPSERVFELPVCSYILLCFVLVYLHP